MIHWIWAYHIKYKSKKIVERLTMWLAWRMPKHLVMWCAIRVIAHATTNEYGSTVVPELGAMDALERWETA